MNKPIIMSDIKIINYKGFELPVIEIRGSLFQKLKTAIIILIESISFSKCTDKTLLKVVEVNPQGMSTSKVYMVAQMHLDDLREETDTPNSNPFRSRVYEVLTMHSEFPSIEMD